jgi:hypothetical protein
MYFYNPNRMNLLTSAPIVMTVQQSSGWTLSHSLPALDSRQQNFDMFSGWSSTIVLCCW